MSPASIGLRTIKDIAARVHRNRKMNQAALVGTVSLRIASALTLFNSPILLCSKGRIVLANPREARSCIE
jgi:succinylarginine dihydrolase